MLIDMHAHSSGISRCCRYDAREVIDRAKALGLSGIVLTNHYQKDYIKSSAEEFVEGYIAEYRSAAEYGKQVGLKVFFGVEVTVASDPKIHMLVYGIGEDGLRAEPMLFDMDLPTLSRRVHSLGGVLVQAHPFRNGATVLDTAFLDGLEINCHPLYSNTHSGELVTAAQKAGIMLTCGGDYHGDTYRPDCGTYLPDDIVSDEDIAKFILTSQVAHLRVQEIDRSPEERSYTVRQKRKEE